jgi:hypothetical protein
VAAALRLIAKAVLTGNIRTILQISERGEQIVMGKMTGNLSRIRDRLSERAKQHRRADDPAANHAKIPFTLVRNEVGSPSMHQLNEQPWRVEAT